MGWAIREVDEDEAQEAQEEGGIVDDFTWLQQNNQFTSASNPRKTLEAGSYNVTVNYQGIIYFEPKKFNVDDILDINQEAVNAVTKNLKSFWKSQSLYKNLGVLWKRGILLHGPPGCGKTAVTSLVSKEVIDNHDGIVLSPRQLGFLQAGIKDLRKVEPNRKVLVIMEDIDQHMADEEDQAALLNILDGNDQIENVLYVSTTNFPEKLGHRIVNRPSRFDLVIPLGMPSADSRERYLTHLRSFENGQLEEWVNKTKDLSIAHIKEIVLAVDVFGASFEEALQRVRSMKDRPSSWDFAEKAGNYA